MKARHYLVLMLLWMVLIWSVSSLPSDNIPSSKIFGIDKLAHFGIYFIWGLISALHLRRINASSPLQIFIISIMLLLAACDEYHQLYIPGRQVSIFDLCANWLGLLSAHLIFKILSKIRKHDYGKRATN
ncbi:MAG: hypothetical protein PWP64_203 [Candidatus Cloacimonadota bacterium]|nr:hypothetical protein [Candidatus Cloacimonadota bacterium]